MPKKYVVYRFANTAEAVTHMNDGKKVYAIVPGNKVGLSAGEPGNSYFMVTSLDKNNNESQGGIVILLPVTGLNMTVRLSGNTTTVFWTTLTEVNSRNFEIERSADGVNFKPVALVSAAGTSNGERNYSIQDFLPASGTYYYRVKTIGGDGSSSYSLVKSVLYRYAAAEIVLGPNPFESGINISNLQQVKRLDIIDLSGRTVISKMLSNQPSIRLEAPGLPAGFYNLKLTKTNGEYFFIRLVKL